MVLSLYEQIRVRKEPAVICHLSSVLCPPSSVICHLNSNESAAKEEKTGFDIKVRRAAYGKGAKMKEKTT
jgi:hypothetical protein